MKNKDLNDLRFDNNNLHDKLTEMKIIKDKLSLCNESITKLTKDLNDSNRLLIIKNKEYDNIKSEYNKLQNDIKAHKESNLIVHNTEKELQSCKNELKQQ